MKTKSTSTDRVSPQTAEKLRRAGFQYAGPGNQHGFPLSDSRHPRHGKFIQVMKALESPKAA